MPVAILPRSSVMMNVRYWPLADTHNGINNKKGTDLFFSSHCHHCCPNFLTVAYRLLEFDPVYSFIDAQVKTFTIDSSHNNFFIIIE